MARKRPRPWALACGACFVLSIIPAARAQETASADAGPITLGQALDYAEAHYPTVKAALGDRVAASRQVEVARTVYLPQVNLLAQINRATFNNITGVMLPQATIPVVSGPVLPETGRSDWNSTAGAYASWRVFDGGVRAAHVDVERQNAAAADAAYDLTRLDVGTATLNAYLNVLTANALKVAAQSNVERLQTFSTAVHVLVTNKLRPEVEAQQADAALALSQTRLISADTEAQAQMATLARLLGRPVESIRLAALPEAPTGPVMPDRAAKDHPSAIVGNARVGREAARLSAISRSYAPSVDVVAGAYSRGSGRRADGSFVGGSSGLGFGTNNWAAGLQMTIPLGSYPTLHAQQRAQEAALGAERDRYEAILREVIERQQQARATFAGAIEIAKITPSQLLAARTAETQQRARFQSGLASAVDVTIAEATLAQAEAQEAIAQFNVWRAMGGYAAALGDLAPVHAALAHQ